MDKDKKPVDKTPLEPLVDGMWIHKLKIYQAEVSAITATLESQGMDNIFVYPKSPGCYTFSATRNFKQVNGNTCEVKK